jgi:hypothetical protein
LSLAKVAASPICKFMKALHPELTSVAVLAQLLDRLDASPLRVDADQYQLVVRKLDALLGEWLALPEGPQALAGLLAQSPALSTVYENRVYSQAGLSRAPLGLAVKTELDARQALQRAAAVPAPSNGTPAPGAAA